MLHVFKRFPYLCLPDQSAHKTIKSWLLQCLQRTQGSAENLVLPPLNMKAESDSLALLTPAWPWRVAAREDLDWWKLVASTSVQLSCLLGPQESCAVIGSRIYYLRLHLRINHWLIFLQKYLCWLNRATRSRQNLLLLLLSKGSVEERPMAVILSLNGDIVRGLFVFPLNENSGFKALR